MTISFYPLLPVWLILLLLALSVGAGAYAYRRRNPAVEPWQHTLLLTLRMTSLLLVTLMLLCPGQMTEDLNLEKSHIVFMVDQSASMATKDLPEGRSRWECATAFLRKNRFDRLAGYPLAFYTFNSQTRRHTTADALAALIPEGGTDFKQAITAVDKDLGLNRTAALVLLSDGIDFSGFRGSELSVPIMSVQLGTDLAKVKDLGIEPVKCPEKITAGEEVNLEIPLLMRGYAHEMPVVFRVWVDNQPAYNVTPMLTSGRMQTETFKTTFAKTGIHVIRIECQKLSDEVTELNNHRELVIEVVTAKNEVAAYFPILNNSFRPLLREFSKDEETVFTALYRVSGNTFRVRGTKLNSNFKDGLPKNADQWKSLTCLILGSHNNDLLSPAEALVLEDYVNKGGSLICLAGTDSYGKLPAGSPLLRLLPVVNLEESFRAGTFTVVPEPSATDAFTAQIRQIIQDNVPSPDLVISGINQIKDLKASAKVLLWAEGESRYPLLAWHAFGRGKVIALLSNSLNQWGALDKRDENFGRFWRQLVAFAENQNEDADLLKVTLDRTELAPNERVAITALARHPDGHDKALTVKADVFPVAGDIPIETLTLQKKAGTFMGEVTGLKHGRYVVRVSSQDSKEVLRTRYKLLLVGDVLEENTRIRSDRESFRAYSSEKHIFSPGETARLEDLLCAAVRKNVVQRERFLIFETPAFFLVLVLLLMAEWFLRRRFNLF